MTAFPLKIVTPDGLKFDGHAEELIVRTTSGDIGFLAGHLNCVAPLGMGRATVIIDGSKRYGACIGGMVSMIDGKATLVPSSFEWAEDIDVARAEKAKQESEAILAAKKGSQQDLRLAEARLHRALVRKSVAETK